MGLRDDLIAARALIADPADWCKGVEPQKNCTMWAIAKVTNQPHGGGRWSACDQALRRALPRIARLPNEDHHPIVAFNDRETTTHADIMALFDRAINAAPVDFTGLDAALEELKRPL